MKRIRRLATILVAAMVPFLVPWSANATTILDEAVNGLKQSDVFVAPGTEGTDGDTAGTLLTRLDKDDSIILVMLPSNALTATDDSPQAFAQKLSEALGGKHIIGLSVGSDAIGYAPILPGDTAADLMHRAVTVSTNTTETLGTFVQNIHDYQVQHPEAKPPVSTPSDSSGIEWPTVIIFCALGVVCGIAFGWYQIRSKTQRKLRSPRQVRDVLRRLIALQERIEDHELNATIEQIVTDTEYFFKRRSRKKRDDDAAILLHHLRNGERVLDKYIEIQNANQRYYRRDKHELLRAGRDSIEQLSAFILNVAQEAEEDAMSALTTEFTVDTSILNAVRTS